MGLSGKHKAAMLLTVLDGPTAGELLKGQPQEVVREIVFELSRMDAAGDYDVSQAIEVGREFCQSLGGGGNRGGSQLRDIVEDLLKASAGREKVAEIRTQIKKSINDKNPFIAIAAENPSQIASVIKNEPAQLIALVLSNLPTKTSTKVLRYLEEDMSLKVVWKMTQPAEVPPKTMQKIGQMILRKLLSLRSVDRPVQSQEEGADNQNLRKVALILNGLDKERRAALMEEIEGNDDDIARAVKMLMVTWEDIPKIEDKSLQQALRKVDAGVLAMALHGADEIIVKKIRSNISERAGQMVDEETSLMSAPGKKEVAEAREKVAEPLREANEADELKFIEEE